MLAKIIKTFLAKTLISLPFAGQEIFGYQLKSIENTVLELNQSKIMSKDVISGLFLAKAGTGKGFKLHLTS